jgi:hypothetical protein
MERCLASSFAKRATPGARLACEADIEGVPGAGGGYGGQVARPMVCRADDDAGRSSGCTVGREGAHVAT